MECMYTRLELICGGHQWVGRYSRTAHQPKPAPPPRLTTGHAPQRFTAIAQPTLLIFDTEDAGHPVAVGRQMRRHLQQPHYFEFTRSVDGDWECQHTGEELWRLITAHWSAPTLTLTRTRPVYRDRAEEGMCVVAQWSGVPGNFDPSLVPKRPNTCSGLGGASDAVRAPCGRRANSWQGRDDPRTRRTIWNSRS